jgi:hypothetical protein
MANFGYAGRLTETILIGNLALRAGEGTRIAWDAKALKSPNVPEVNQFVSRVYREGWELEGLNGMFADGSAGQACVNCRPSSERAKRRRIFRRRRR